VTGTLSSMPPSNKCTSPRFFGLKYVMAVFAPGGSRLRREVRRRLTAGPGVRGCSTAGGKMGHRAAPSVTRSPRQETGPGRRDSWDCRRREVRAQLSSARGPAHRRQHRQAAKHSCALSINVKHKVDLHLPHSVCCLNIMRFGEARTCRDFTFICPLPIRIF
jgi:hypothetical protein